MNNKFKLPKIDILFQTITILKAMVLPSIFVIINLFRKVEWWIPVSVIGAILLLVSILAFFSWRSFSYVFEKDRIIIYSGMIQKKEKTIYYSRIHSVNIKQNIIHRMLGLANLTIETPGAGISADGEVRCLSYDKAKHLQHLLQRMGEASRKDEEEKKLQLLHSIMLNMENSTSRDVIVNDESSSMPYESVDQTELNIAVKNSLSSNTVADQSAHLDIEASEQNKADLKLTLNSELMLKSALTSLNINIVLVWFAGLFAFADDIFNTFFPDSTFFDDLLGQFNFSKNIVIFIVVVLIGAIFMTWVLSIFFYFIKFFDYKLERKGKQISVSYGLFNRQSIVFNETKVQSLVFDENPLRQMMGYGEIKVNIVRSAQDNNQVDNSYIVVHPFIKKDEIRQYLEQLMPKCNVAKHEDTESLPMKSLYTYLLVPMIISVIPTLATVYWFHFKSLWFLVFPIIVFVMRYIQFKSAAFSIDGKELKLVTRRFSKYTVYVRRQKIISFEQKCSPYQRKHQLGKISVRTLGGILAKNYALNGVKEEHINQTRTWLQAYIKNKK